ncbi:hypothetical protein C8Q74DRAFT_1286954, partial [Fomes fomentarius]
MTNGTPTRAEGGRTIFCRIVDRTRCIKPPHLRPRPLPAAPHCFSVLDCRSSGSGSTDGCRLQCAQPSLNSAFRQVRAAYRGVTELQRTQHDTAHTISFYFP